ncbi:GNAT family N-acetyltransferase [Actinomycetaceae bacterium MB13-C1-2]|nr:GNAT family N-acetyltransferase [Actinomycetaceae bacterium MB13-C1-2]
MTEVRVTAGKVPPVEQLLDLYDAVGWSSYTQNPERLVDGVKGSLRVVTAHSKEDQLVGLARIVGDGHTIAYLQDVLVHPDWQRSGIGAWLIREAFLPYEHVHQQVLLTDNEPAQRAFYESLGFAEIRDVPNEELRAFVRFNRS